MICVLIGEFPRLCSTDWVVIWIGGENNVEDWQTRVIQERDDLSVKLVALEKFMTGSATFGALLREDKNLLREQCSAMMEYRDVLEERIAKFSKT